MTTPDIQSLVESVLRLDKEASPAPWKLWGMQVMSDPKGASNVADCIPVADTYYTVDGRPRTWNADLIATYRTAAPILARACNEKDEEITRLRAELAEEKRKVEVANLLAITMEHGESCNVQIGMRSDLSRYEVVPCDCGLTKLRAALTTPSEGGEL